MDKKHDFTYRPWEHGEEPCLVNEEGWGWYVDAYGNEKVRKEQEKRKTTLPLYVFLIKKTDEVVRVIIDDKQNILWCGTNLEAFFCWVEIFIIANKPEKEEKEKNA